MLKKIFLVFLLVSYAGFSQESDFKHINFSKADIRAKSYKAKNLRQLHKITYDLTKGFETDVEKFRAIYVWICHNISNDYWLYRTNEKKRKKFENDSINLQEWNSKFKKLLFNKLIKRKKTICTGYAYILKEMCNIAGLKSLMVHGYGRTSDVDLNLLTLPNHSWNVIKLNNKWYLCDPTWAAGISRPEDNRFQFKYNDGYFLTEPNLFFYTHFPLDKQFALTDHQDISFNDYAVLPLFYGGAYKYISKNIAPNKMHHEIELNDTITFKYLLKKPINLKKVKLVYFKADTEYNLKPKLDLKLNTLTINNTFKKKGFFDIHLFIDKEIVATYTINVTKLP